MSNQFILWSMFIVPWMTLAFMKRAEIKRYIPVGLFAGLTSTIIHDVGVSLGFWVVGEVAFPFNSLHTYLFGLLPVLTMWVFKFTNGRFWLYMGTNAVLDLGFNFILFGYLLPYLGILSLVGITSFQGWFITLGHAVIVYGFQKLYEGEPIDLRISRLNPQNAAAKPFFRDKSYEDKH